MSDKTAGQGKPTRSCQLRRALGLPEEGDAAVRAISRAEGVPRGRGGLGGRHVRATEPVLGLSGARNNEPEIPLSELERFREKDEKEFHKYLKKETGRSSVATIKRALAAELDGQLVSKFRTVCHHDDGLWQRIEPFAGLVRIDTFGYAIEIHCSENRTLGDAVKFIAKAFSVWVPIMERIELLDRQNAVEAVLLDELAEFTKAEGPMLF